MEYFALSVVGCILAMLPFMFLWFKMDDRRTTLWINGFQFRGLGCNYLRRVMNRYHDLMAQFAPEAMIQARKEAVFCIVGPEEWAKRAEEDRGTGYEWYWFKRRFVVFLPNDPAAEFLLAEALSMITPVADYDRSMIYRRITRQQEDPGVLMPRGVS